MNYLPRYARNSFRDWMNLNFQPDIKVKTISVDLRFEISSEFRPFAFSKKYVFDFANFIDTVKNKL
jgi:hypothetical protein